MENSKVLMDEELEEISGGKSGEGNQSGKVKSGKWYTKRNDGFHIYKASSVMVLTDKGNHYSSRMYMFERYWYNEATGMAWNNGTCSDSDTSGNIYCEHSAPLEIDDTMTIDKPF